MPDGRRWLRKGRLAASADLRKKRNTAKRPCFVSLSPIVSRLAATVRRRVAATTGGKRERTRSRTLLSVVESVLVGSVRAKRSRARTRSTTAAPSYQSPRATGRLSFLLALFSFLLVLDREPSALNAIRFRIRDSLRESFSTSRSSSRDTFGEKVAYSNRENRDFRWVSTTLERVYFFPRALIGALQRLSHSDAHALRSGGPPCAAAPNRKLNGINLDVAWTMLAQKLVSGSARACARIDRLGSIRAYVAATCLFSLPIRCTDSKNWRLVQLSSKLFTDLLTIINHRLYDRRIRRRRRKKSNL